VRSELYATGARPRTTALDGVESLTERELRVARLAAEGQTHLSNSYRKLGIASRRELPAALSSP
jgi:DNA-binding CsgD family transcriptional regulator